MTRRRLLLALGIVAVVLVVAIEGVRRYASTQLVSTLAEIYGGRVEADGARAGYRNATLHGMRFYEADGTTVLLELEELRTDLTLWDLVVGRTTPDRMWLLAPEITLRFNERGELITQVPEGDVASGALPELVELSDATLVVDEAGRRTAFRGATVRLANENGLFDVDGTLDDPHWGEWQLGGTLDLASSEAALTAANPRVVVSPEWLRGLPLVPADVWQQFEARGPIDVQLGLTSNPSPGEPNLRASLKPQQAELFFPALDIAMHSATGELLVEDRAARIRNLQGEVAGGTLQAEGQIDLADPLAVQVNVELDSVDAAKLPPSWSVPAGVAGKASGQAQLNVAFAGDQLQASGEGRLQVSEASVGGVPIEPFDVALMTPPAPHDAPEASEIHFDLRLRDAPVEALLQQLPAVAEAAPKDVRGVVSTDLAVAIPLATLSDLATYRVNGAVASRQLVVSDVELLDTRAQIDLAGGRLQIQELEASVAGGPNEALGQIAGSADANLKEGGSLTFDVTASEIPLGLLASFVDLEPLPTGRASAVVSGQVPLEDASDLAAWRLAGQVSASQVQLDGRTMNDVAADVRVAQGDVRFENIRGSLGEMNVTATAAARLESPYPYQIDFRVSETPVASLVELAEVEFDSPLTGAVRAVGRVDGTLDPMVWDARGAAASAELRVDRWTATDLVFDWNATPDALSVANLSAGLFGGTVAVNAVLPLSDEAAPSLRGTFREMSLAAIARSALESAPEIGGTLQGSFAFTGRDAENATGELQVQGEQVTALGVPARDLTAAVQLDAGQLTYQAAAMVFDGSLAIDGQTALAADLEQTTLGAGSIRIESIQLQELAQRFGPRERLPLTGLANLELEYAPQENSSYPEGRGRLTVRDLRWAGRDLSPRVEGQVVLSRETLRIPQVTARLGEGSLRAAMIFDLERFERGRYSLAIDRVAARDLLAAWPDAASQIEGAIDARLRGALGRRVTGAGTVAMAHGRLSGVEVTGVRLPVHFQYAADSGRGELRVAESTIQAARGRITASAEATLGQQISLAARMRLVNLELRSLAQSADVGQLGSGRVSGRATLASNDFRSINDLNGTFNLSLTQSQAFQFPVLRNVARFVTPAAPASISIEQGEIRGRLARGIVTIQRMALTGSDIRLLAEGAVSLQGRIDLDVTAQRGGQPLAESLVRRVVVPIIQVQTVPIGLLTQANDLLSDRVIFLRVTGTVRSPAIQLRPAPQLQQEAVRFFLGGIADQLGVSELE